MNRHTEGAPMATVVNAGLLLVVLGLLLLLGQQQRREWSRARATSDEVLTRLESVASVHQVTQQDLANLERGVMTRLAELMRQR
jgi:cytochrome c biogenesis protein ResB